jgi:tRNA 2-thiouridine synthesizing protein E
LPFPVLTAKFCRIILVELTDIQEGTMTIEVAGKTIETTETGFLVNLDDWNEEIAQVIADEEGISLTQEHWDVINYLRDEFINNAGNQPNNRNMLKEMGKIWGKKISSKDLYDLFPGNPSKQAGRIGGLPESRRKGGY